MKAVITLQTSDPETARAGLGALSMIDLERIDWRDAVVATALDAYAIRRVGADASMALSETAPTQP
jgi:hypothetical protein